MRYRLRTLLIVLTIGPAIIAAIWWAIQPAPFNDYRITIPMPDEDARPNIVEGP